MKARIRREPKKQASGDRNGEEAIGVIGFNSNRTATARMNNKNEQQEHMNMNKNKNKNKGLFKQEEYGIEVLCRTLTSLLTYFLTDLWKIGRAV